MALDLIYERARELNLEDLVNAEVFERDDESPAGTTTGARCGTRADDGLHPRPLEGPGPQGQGQALAGQVPGRRPREGRRQLRRQGGRAAQARRAGGRACTAASGSTRRTARRWRSTPAGGRRADRTGATTAQRVDRQITRQIEGMPLGGRRLVSVRPSDVQAWTAALSAQGLAPSSMRLSLRLLAAVFNAAVLDRLVASSPRDQDRAAARRGRACRPADRRRRSARWPRRCRSGAGRWSTCRPASVCGSASCSRCACRTSTSCGARCASSTSSSATPGPGSSRRRRGRAGRSRCRRWSPRSWPRTSRRTRPCPTGRCSTAMNGRPYDHAYYGSRIFAGVAVEAGRGEGLDVPGRDDDARPAAPLRERAARRGRVGGRRRGAPRPRGRDDGADGSTGTCCPTPRTAPGRAVDDAWEAGGVRRGSHGPGTARVIICPHTCCSTACRAGGPRFTDYR